MIATTKSTALSNLSGICVNVEVDLNKGLPSFSIIGLGDTAVREAADRVRSALINRGYDYPKGKITVNLVPAWVRKSGTHFDLAIAIGLLVAEEIIDISLIENKVFVGELSLSGDLISCKGILPMLSGLNGEAEEVFVPKDNCREAYLATRGMNVKIIGVSDISEAIEIINGERIGTYYEYDFDENALEDYVSKLDFSDVKGHWVAKDAIVTAISGGHGLLLIGSPGTGKTLLAKRIPTILPKMSFEEQLETSRIYSLVGGLTPERPIISERPFRQISKRATEVTILGGGHEPLPGEISLANNGILFIDELLEFSRSQIESLRKPIEDKKITIVRKGEAYTFPAKFTLVAATNPCKCGYYGDPNKPCICTQAEIDQYRNRLSGPICERIDMCVEIPRIDYNNLTGENSMSSKEMLKKVTIARNIQNERFKDLEIVTNSEMSESMIKRYCRLDTEESQFMERAYNKYNLSPRRYHKVLKLARTISDIAEKDRIDISSLSQAMGYTRFLNGNDK